MIDNDLGGPAPCGRRRAIRFTPLRSVLAPIPAATEPRGGVGIFHSATGGMGIIAANNRTIVETLRATSLQPRHTFDIQIVGANDYSPLQAVAIDLPKSIPPHLISVTFPFLRVSISPKHFTFMK